jgi:nucleotide-binding universal stress UspA family protein
MPTINHILFPFDFSKQGVTVAPLVAEMARTFGATVTVLSVAPPAWAVLGGADAGMEDSAPDVGALQERLDQSLVHELADLQVRRIAEGGDPALRIAAFAAANGVDLIMLPTHGHGRFRTLLVGSVTAKVLHDVTCPVWTAAHAEEQPEASRPRQVLCALDTAAESRELLLWANAFCVASQARLDLLYVVSPLTDAPGLARERHLQEQARARARADIETLQREAGLDCPLRVAVGSIVTTVAEEARQAEADLIIIGRGAIGSPFGRFRTHAFGIVERSPCPVITV